MTPEIKNCTVQECFYNHGELCHADAILVGSGHPACDTFITWQNFHGTPSPLGHVGACHENDCKFNRELSCHAPSISIDHHEGHADCVTFEPRPELQEDIDIDLLDETEEAVFEGSTNVRVSGEEIE